MSEETPSTEKPKRKNRGTLRPPDRPFKVAAMVGAGMTQKAIARELGVTPSAVSITVKKIDRDPELQRVRENARKELGGDAIRILKLNLRRVEETLRDGQEVVTKDGGIVRVTPPLAHMASSMRELANIASIRDQEQPGAMPALGGGTIPMTPEAIAQMVEAVRRHQLSLSAPRDVTHEGERIA